MANKKGVVSDGYNGTCKDCLDGQYHFRSFGCRRDGSEDLDCQRLIAEARTPEERALLSMTRQGHKDECDINVLMAKYEETGYLPVSNREASFGDFSGVTDYLSAVNTLQDTMDMFMQLPAKLRKRFENDPSKLIEFVSDRSNREEAIQLGLIDVAPVAPKGGGSPTPDVKDVAK